MGCLQLDPISAVARSHLLVLHSRLGQYDPELLDQLLWRDRSLFEYWAHCAAIVPISDYPIHNRHMRDYDQCDTLWGMRRSEWIAQNQPLREMILAKITADGATPSRAFENIELNIKNWHSTGWTSGRNVSRMLDFLWMDGTLMVAGRAGIQKLWDLSERCLPAHTPREKLSVHDVTYLAVQRAIKALGVATPAQIKQHFIRSRYAHLPQTLKTLLAQGRIERVQVMADQPLGGEWYLHCDDVALLEQISAGQWQPRTVLLSPFDNLICDRKRTKQMWGFDFTIEIYVPKHKRKYGYYVMPILHGDRLIGRVDPQMDRQKSVLTIHNIHFEPNVTLDASTNARVDETLTALATFLGAKKIDFESQSL